MTDRCPYCGADVYSQGVTTGASGGWLFKCDPCDAEWVVRDEELTWTT